MAVTLAATEITIDRAVGEKRESTVSDNTRRERLRALILPREHGAWGLLLVPLATGAGIAIREGGRFFPVLVLLTAALALFWLRTPAESLLGTSLVRVHSKDERRLVAGAVVTLGVVAKTALVALLWAGHNPYLWGIGVVAGAAFLMQARLKKLGRQARMVSEIVGTIGLTSLAPAAYYVATGRFGVTAWMLWLANLAFAGNQIHYVQLRIHTAKIESTNGRFKRGWTFAIGQLAMGGILLGAAFAGWIPRLVLAAFASILFRGWFYFFKRPAPLRVRLLGWSELAQAIVFCIVLIGASALR